MVVIRRQYGDHAHHRRSEVSTRVLDAASRSGRDGLIDVIEVGVKPAVVHERAGLRELEAEPTRLARVGVGPG